MWIQVTHFLSLDLYFLSCDFTIIYWASIHPKHYDKHYREHKRESLIPYSLAKSLMTEKGCQINNTVRVSKHEAGEKKHQKEVFIKCWRREQSFLAQKPKAPCRKHVGRVSEKIWTGDGDGGGMDREFPEGKCDEEKHRDKIMGWIH